MRFDRLVQRSGATASENRDCVVMQADYVLAVSYLYSPAEGKGLCTLEQRAEARREKISEYPC